MCQVKLVSSLFLLRHVVIAPLAVHVMDTNVFLILVSLRIHDCTDASHVDGRADETAARLHRVPVQSRLVSARQKGARS